MEDNREYSINLPEIFGKLKKNWKRIAVWTASAFAVSLVIGFSLPRKYVAGSKLAPEISNTTTTRLSTLTSLAGLNSNLLGSTDAVYPMVYPEVVTSTDFVTDLFALPVKVTDGDAIVETTLYDYVQNYVKRPWWSAMLGAPAKWIDKLTSKEADCDQAGTDSLAVNPYRLTKKQSNAVKYLSSCIESTIDKKTLIVTNIVTMQDPVIAADVCTAVNENLKKYVTAYRTDKALKDEEYYKKIYLESQQDYYDAQRRYSRYVDSHQNIALQSVRAEQDRLQNEMNLQFQVYSNSATQLQAASAKVQQETPVFAQIISPTVPIKPAGPSKKKIALAFILLGLCCGTADVLLRENRN